MKNIALISLSSLIFFFLGFLANSMVYKYNILSCDKQVCFIKGQEESLGQINEKYKDIDTAGSQNTDRKYLNGIVKEVSDGSITVEYKSFAIIPDKNLTLRQVNISTAKIEKMLKKDDAVYQAEVKSYESQKSIKSPGALDEYPAQYYYAPANFEDLRSGQLVYIEAENPIEKEMSFSAKLIRIVQ